MFAPSILEVTKVGYSGALEYWSVGALEYWNIGDVFPSLRFSDSVLSLIPDP
jgi:hypothetical protein